MKIYLDNCCFNRPYDEQLYETIRLESEAKLFVQEKIHNGSISLVWSFILDFENNANPYDNQKELIAEWKQISCENVTAEMAVLERARDVATIYRVKPKDAIHIASAIFAHCDYFLTTDRQLLKKVSSLKEIRTINPIDFIQILEGKL
ncbi:MAG TPA: type II toxin-antitoxin system VapC family toxin [Candidatus Wunengus sp. YC61]|uniref:type II toxin-antitoxin system VapC family toxin n=1 Tax=Candidatus Wunengus sp. YC61 TaxID=3367698 RepID=UPI00402907BB